jgi:cytochrome c
MYRFRALVPVIVCISGCVFLFSGRTNSFQSERLYTQTQAERGKRLYAQHCALCHGQSLEGNPSTPLAGERFMAKWGQGTFTLDDFYYLTKTQMPYGKPDSLTPQQYIDIVAFACRATVMRLVNVNCRPIQRLSKERSSSVSPDQESRRRRLLRRLLPAAARRHPRINRRRPN